MQKKWIYIVLILLLLLCAICIFRWEIKEIPVKQGTQYRIVNYNLKYADPSSSTFKGRKELMVEQLLSYDADIITLQEANYGWMYEDDTLVSMLNGYSYVGVGREDGETQGEFVPIFYLSDVFEVIEEDTIWLSETPNEVSIGWDASTYRIMSSVTLQNKETGEKITVHNTHLDHEGGEARSQSIHLILETIGKGENPYFLVGDMNFPSFFSEYFAIVTNMDDTKSIAKSSMKHGTLNYNTTNKLFHFLRIDYIFASKNDFVISSYRVDPSYVYMGQPISDHFPIIVDFTCK